MNRKEVEKLRYTDACYTELLCSMRMFNDRLDKVTLIREKLENGKRRAIVICHLKHDNGNVCDKKYSLFADDYLWFLNSISNDFPNVEFVDLTPDDLKPVEGSAENRE